MTTKSPLIVSLLIVASSSCAVPSSTRSYPSFDGAVAPEHRADPAAQVPGAASYGSSAALVAPSAYGSSAALVAPSAYGSSAALVAPSAYVAPSGPPVAVAEPLPTWTQAEAVAGPPPKPWSRFGVSVSGLMAVVNSDVRIGGSGVGVGVDLEELLDMDTSTRTLELDGFWRFSENMRHRVDLSWMRINRTGDTTLGQDLDLGNGTILPLGTNVSTRLDLSLIRLNYSYSFFQDERIDLALTGGFYVAPIDFQIDASGGTTYNDSLKFTAPLPVIGLRGDVALTPKWYLRNELALFYFEYDDYRGSISDITSSVEYRFFENFALGLGVNAFKLAVESESSSSIPGVDRSGSVDFGYTGAFLTLKALW